MSVSRADFDRYFTPNYAPAPDILVEGAGSRVRGQSGREYVDLAAGIAVNVLGHAPPELVEVLSSQAHRLWHLSNAYANEPAIELARSLTERTFADRVFLANSGGEANEAALKLARRWAHDRHGPQKHEIVSFHSSFHGRTLFTVSVGGQPAYREGFGPTPGGITHLPFNDLDAVGDAIGPDTAAVIVEPVQGEGGLVPADPAFVARLRSLCTAHDVLLVFDEIQSGVGRTGSLYAYMDLGIEPDILTTAKGLGGGFPIGAMLCRDDVGQAFVVGTHGSTFGGNPLGAAVAAKVLEIVDTPEFLAEVRRKAELLRDGLTAVGARTGAWSMVRGSGLWLGAVLDGTWAGRSKDVAATGFDHGVMTLRAGADVVRVAPALNIPDEDIHEGLRRLEDAVTELAGRTA
jgi:succinylornithine transaminase family protein